MRNCWLTPNKQFFGHIMARTIYKCCVLSSEAAKKQFYCLWFVFRVLFTDTSERYSKIILKGVQIMCSETNHNTTTNSTRQTTIKQCMTKPSSKFGEKKLKNKFF